MSLLLFESWLFVVVSLFGELFEVLRLLFVLGSEPLLVAPLPFLVLLMALLKLLLEIIFAKALATLGKGWPAIGFLLLWLLQSSFNVKLSIYERECANDANVMMTITMMMINSEMMVQLQSHDAVNNFEFRP